MSYYVTNENSFLDIKNAHLRVTGNVHTDVMKLGAIEFQPTGSEVTGTVNFTNVTTGVTTSSNLNVGGTLQLGTVEVVATTHTLANTTAKGNVTPHTIEVSNVTTGLVTTANVEVGRDLVVTGNVSAGKDLTVTGNVADLNIVSNVNMLHTSNTASIKLNSNVVTEFPRSKKLIKYPRVALTGYSQDGYVTSGSADNYNSSGFYTYNAFNNIQGNEGWHGGAGNSTTVYHFIANSGGSIYDTSKGGSLGGNLGEWLKLELPLKIVVDSLILKLRSASQHPKDFKILGSNDDVNWDILKSVTNNSSSGSQKHTIGAITGYKYIAMLVTRVHSTGVIDTVISELEYFGTPEYDPEAHGVDVTVKSLPNVPNTDWLEVYYDAKDLADGAVSTTSGAITGLGGTTNNGTALGDPQVSNGAFVFDGTGDFITSTTLSTHFEGDPNVTYACWVKFNAMATGQMFLTINAPGVYLTNKIGGFYIGTDGILYNTIGSRGIQATEKLTTNIWYHIVGTKITGNSGTDTQKLYIDGSLVPQTIWGSSGTQVIGSNPILRLGGAGNGNDRLNGSIANTRLFNRALTQDEIYQLYAYQKEYFGHGDLSMTLKAGRLGIGTSEPRAALDVRGGIAGPFHTFLTGDYTTASSVDFTANHQVKALASYTFDVPKEYNSYGTANLEVFGQVKWSGEVTAPWNCVMKLRVYYGSGLSQIIYSAENPAAGSNNRGCGMIAISNHADNGSTLDSAIASSRFLIPNCSVGPGSQLKLEILIQQGNQTTTVYTNRTTGSTTTDPNYERGTTNFFMALKVV